MSGTAKINKKSKTLQKTNPKRHGKARSFTENPKLPHKYFEPLQPLEPRPNSLDVELGYKKNILHFGSEPLAPYLKHAPCYVYSKSGFAHRLEVFKKAMSFLPEVEIHYAMKANSHKQALALVKKSGLGVDVVSGGELAWALQCKMDPRKIVFSGVGKTRQELQLAIKKKISSINVESVPELQRILSMSQSTPVLLRFNPDVSPVTHPYISTGFKENKFGMALSEIHECMEVLSKRKKILKGISIHIGSQLLDFSAFDEALEKSIALFYKMHEQGYAVDTLDVGGGVGIAYDQSAQSDWEYFEKYLQVLKKHLTGFAFKVAFEPGRFLIARCGVLLTEVQYIKKTDFKTFVILNSGMNHLIRPALYEAYHRILALKLRPGSEKLVDVVGPVCESSDYFAKNRMLPEIVEGDGLVLCDAGAYGMSMASNYNQFALPREIWI
jgi:diaminopimelate decarboxylase